MVCLFLLSFTIIFHLQFAITFLSLKCVCFLWACVCVCVCTCAQAWSYVCPTKFPSSYVHFLNLHSINDFILFWVSLSFQFLGLIDYFAISDAFILQPFTKHLGLPTLLPNQWIILSLCAFLCYTDTCQDKNCLP